MFELLERAMDNLGYHEASLSGNLATLVAPGRRDWVLRWNGKTWLTHNWVAPVYLATD